MMNHYNTDVAIVGAGPIGLFSVFQAGILGMKCHVVDALDYIGGQCAALYPEKPIYDIPAYPQISGQELINQLYNQAQAYSPNYSLGECVLSCDKTDDDRFKLLTSNDNSISAKIVIIAAGCGAFGPNRPPIENIKMFEKNSVFYSVQNREIFRNKKVMIAGGGDSAVDWAISLSEITEKLYLVHRRDRFRCIPGSLEKLNSLKELGKIELIIPYQLKELQGNLGALEEVVLSNLNNDILTLKVDCLLPFFGLSMDLGPINDWGLDLHSRNIKVNIESCETSVPGIYAVGDVACYPGKLKLILSGFAESATALHHAYERVFQKSLHFQYSTVKGVPK